MTGSGEGSQIPNGYVITPHRRSVSVIDAKDVRLCNNIHYEEPVTYKTPLDMASSHQKTCPELTGITHTNKVRKICYCFSLRSLFLILIVVSGVISIIIGVTTFCIAMSAFNNGPISIENIHLFNRSGWHARPPVLELDPLHSPVQDVVIAHSATEGCDNVTDCFKMAQRMQNFQVEGLGWRDITYNFLIGGDGSVYEGRGWDKVGDFSGREFSNKAVGICIIGTYTTRPPNPKPLSTTKKFIEHGIALGKIATNYRLLAHNQTKCTSSPGSVLYQILREWPNWQDTEPLNCTVHDFSK